MTTPDQNEARREAIQSLGDVISELPGILHPYNTATAVYAAGWRPPLSTPEASDDEVKVLESAIGEVHFSQWDDVQERVMQSVADAVLAAGFRRSPVPADTPSDNGRVVIHDR